MPRVYDWYGNVTEPTWPAMSAREKVAYVSPRWPVIIETDSRMKREVLEDHYRGNETNLHDQDRCRVEASGSVPHTFLPEHWKAAARSVRSDGPSLHHETADAGPIFADLRQNDQRSVQQIG